ncbi:MAG: LptF/LptG family permease [Blastocatellia bacterium]|nr:LptF/LptG family permease [Blastocatellia bacterium]
MFRQLDRYIIREIIPYFLLSFFLLTSIIFVHEANRFSELFIIFSQRGLSSAPLLLLIISLLPSIFVFTLPISFLLSVLLAFGRLSGDSEIIVMRAGGVSSWQLVRPVMIVAATVMGLTAYNTFYLLPTAVNSLNQLKKKRSQIVVQSITTQIQPGSFTENLPNRVLYIGRSDRTTDTWDKIFIAEQNEDQENKEPRIYTAQAGHLVLGQSLDQTELQLDESYMYEAEARKFKNQKNYPATYAQNSVIRFDLGGKGNDSPENGSELTVQPTGPELMTLPQLWAAVPEAGKERSYAVEIQKRLALPVTCLFFAFIGVALGITVSRSGRSTGLMMGLAVTLLFYLMFLGGEKAARQGAWPVLLGMWGPDLLLGAVSLWLFTDGPSKLGRTPVAGFFWKIWQATVIPLVEWVRARREITETSLATRIKRRRSGGAGSYVIELENGMTIQAQKLPAIGFPRIIDRMIFQEAARHFLFVLAGLSGIFLIFTLFDLINHIVQNQVKIGLVAEYLLFLAPQTINYMLPFAVLVAVMVTFGLYGKTSQLIALNSSGQSLYRLTVPILAGAILTGGFMLVSQEYILPFTNRAQGYLRYLIKGGQQPPQTFYQANRKWLRGQENRMFNFRHFDSEKNEFFGLAVYEINPQTSGLVSRLYARQAVWDAKTSEWVLSKGWRRTFGADGRTLDRTEIKEERLRIAEGPNYFKQEVPEVSIMSIRQLWDQIAELQHNGVDVLSLRIALQGKFANPLTCLVMALVALPFSFTVGRRGALFGVGVGIAIAIVFWGTIGVFDQLGRYEMLPAFWAAWGPNMLFSVGGLYLLFTAKT